MNVEIKVQSHCKVQLIKELNNIVEHLSRNERYAYERLYKHNGVEFSTDGGYAKYAVIDGYDDYVSFHGKGTDAEKAAEALGEEHKAIRLRNGMPE